MPPVQPDQILARGFPLPELRLIRVAGDDRLAFLQGQLTQDVRRANPHLAVLCGWTTAQGRLLLVSQLFADEQALYLTAPAARADDLLRRLRMFVLRAAVRLEFVPHGITGLAGEDAVAEAARALDASSGATRLIRLAGSPARALLVTSHAAAAGAADGSASWDLGEVRDGIPAIAAPVSEAFIPQMVNLDLLDGVSFTKGCYSGQEVITRTRHLGRTRRRMFRFAIPGGQPPVPGDAVCAGGREVGRVVRTSPCDDGHELLAVIQLEAMADELSLAADTGRTLRPLPLPYAIPEAVQP